jgi:hypothetical protein
LLPRFQRDFRFAPTGFAGCGLLVVGSSKENCEGYLLKAKSYRDLEIYKLSYELAMKIHRISLKLHKYEF